MNIGSRSFGYGGLAVLLALAAALFLFTPARAEGEPPPPETPAAPVEETAINPVEAPPQAGGDAHSPPEEAGGTGFEPLAISSAGMDLQINAGPRQAYYKSGGITYQFLQFGSICPVVPGFVCTVSTEDDPIEDALIHMDTNGFVPSDRFLYILSGTGAYNNNDEVDINGSASPEWAQLKGIIGEVDPDTNEPLVNIQDAFQIANIPGGFFLKGLNVIASGSICSSAVCLNNNAGTLKLEDVWIQGTASQAYGLSVLNHNGSVEFNRVKVNDNPENGARIETTTASGSIKITSSSFDGNGGAPGVKQYNGLRIVSNQVITLNGIGASGNTGTGLNILRRLDGSETLARNITIKNATFNSNISGDTAYGLGVRLGAASGPNGLYPAGSLILENAVAIGNDETGFQIYNQGIVTLKNILTLNNTDRGTFVNTLGSGKVTASQVRHEGAGNSLSINTPGAVSITGLVDVNGGLYVNTLGGNGNITLMDVSVRDAASTGIELLSGGSVTLKDVQSNNNGNWGIYIQANGSGGVSILGGSGIQNEASENDFHGLYILTNGNITITNLAANDNGNPLGAIGILLNNATLGQPRNITFTDVQASNNYGDGIKIISLGAITLNGVIANDNANGGDGIDLQNPSSVKNVTIQPSKATLLNQFDDNAGFGAAIVTLGAVTLKQVSVSGNDTGGALINIAGVGKAVSIDGGEFDLNEVFGLDIWSAGKITLKNISANNNGVPNDAYGAIIRNQLAPNNHPVSISNGQFSYNEGSGLVVRSFGAVTLSNITAISNDFEVNTPGLQGIGIDVDNSLGKGGVTITASKPQDPSLDEGVYLNQGDGVRVVTTGAIVIKNITSTGNGIAGGLDEYGINLTNTAGVNAAITLTSVIADNNRGDGVVAYSSGAFTVNGLKANNNTLNGVYATAFSPTSALKITVSNAETNDNDNGGLYLRNEGVVQLTNIIANNNEYGLAVDNTGPSFINPVTLTAIGGKTNQMNGNTTFGLSIETFGAIMVSNSQVNGNGGTSAAHLENDGLSKAQKVTISNSTFDDNSDPGAAATNGLEIYSLGNISLTGVSVSGNENYGVYSANDGSEDHKGTFTANNSTFDENGSDGLYAATLGKITLKDISASGNDGAGLDIDNDELSSTASISITNLVANDNQSEGAEIDSDGSVTITNATFIDNNSDGLDIDTGSGAGKVTLNNIFATYNNGKGIDINASNTVTISNASVLSNDSDGIEVDASGFVVSITNSSAVGNNGYGVEIDNNLASINLSGTVFGGNTVGDLYWD